MVIIHLAAECSLCLDMHTYVNIYSYTVLTGDVDKSET